MTSEQLEIFKAIDDILYNDWDPIGINNIAPSYEYRKYTTVIFDLMIDGSDNETIAKMLYEFETSILGFVGSIYHCRKIAEKITKLRFTS
jgi:hypothetical protein